MTTPPLTTTQADILTALLRGRTRKQIARERWNSIKTIDTHIDHIRDRLHDAGLDLRLTHVLVEIGARE